MKYSIMLLMIFMGSCRSSNHAAEVPEIAAPPVSGVRVGGPFEGSETVYRDMPGQIYPADTSPGWYEAGKKLVVSGTVYKKDGKTPAKDIILYYWQTDNSGYYPKSTTMHGRIRGWVKTGADGKYTIYTIKPAPYPNSDIPSHIHFAVIEPGINEYWIDDIQFDDDPLPDKAHRDRQQNRCGNGIVKTTEKDGILYATRDLVLGLNIENYPD